MTTKDLTKRRLRAMNAGPVRFPRTAFADTFPVVGRSRPRPARPVEPVEDVDAAVDAAAPASPAGPYKLVAKTIFTMWQLGEFGDATFVALCGCGEQHVEESTQLLRKNLGEHSCRLRLGRPVELVPVDDVVTIELLQRVLAGLRAL